MKNYIQTEENADGSFNSPVQYEAVFLDKIKQKKYVYVSMGKIPGTGRLVMSLLDVTEKKKAEKRWQGLENQLRKSQKMEAIATLAGGIAHDQVDLVITDQTMPEKTGMELAKQMIAINRKLPVILCSGYADSVTRQKVADTGIRRFVLKPVTAKILSQEIQKVLTQTRT